MSDERMELGICIPTFNRAKYLEINIKNLESHIGGHSVAIFVSDNASSDETSEIVKSLQNSYGNIFYSRNEKNIGYDGNVEKVLKMCTAKYAWLMADDDTIVGDISPLLGLLQAKRPAIVALSYSYRDRTFGKAPYYIEPKKAMMDLTGSLAWCSAVIVNSDIVEQLEFKRYTGTYFLHVGIVLDYLAMYKSPIYTIPNTFLDNLCSVTSLPDVDSDPTKKDLKLCFPYWCEGLINVLMRNPSLNLQDIKDYAHSTHNFNNKRLLNFRANNAFDSSICKQYLDYIKIYNSSPTFVIRGISVFPVALAKIAQKVYFKIRPLQDVHLVVDQ